MAEAREMTVPVTVKLKIDVEGVSTNFDDVGDFHEKFDLPYSHDESVSQLLTPEVQDFRVKFLEEELEEFRNAWAENDLPGAFDALLDLVYVAMGTAHLMGLPWQEGWDEVQRANMTKLRAFTAMESALKSGRSSVLDVIKPDDFVPPDIEGVLARHG